MRRNNVVGDAAAEKSSSISSSDYRMLHTQQDSASTVHSSSSSDGNYSNDQFSRDGRSSCVPYRAITLASVLTVIGALLIVVSLMLFMQRIDPKYNDRTWPVMILGALMFIPGIYHMAIAYYAYMETPGYSYEDIPDFD